MHRAMDNFEPAGNFCGKGNLRVAFAAMICLSLLGTGFQLGRFSAEDAARRKPRPFAQTALQEQLEGAILAAHFHSNRSHTSTNDRVAGEPAASKPAVKAVSDDSVVVSNHSRAVGLLPAQNITGVDRSVNDGIDAVNDFSAAQYEMKRSADQLLKGGSFRLDNVPATSFGSVLDRVGICKDATKSVERKFRFHPHDVTTVNQQAYWATTSGWPGRFFINTHNPMEEKYIAASLHESGVWDKYIRDMMHLVLGPGPNRTRCSTVVDVGANIGYFSLVAAAAGFNVISFEPTNYNMNRLVSSIRRNGFENRVTIFQNAVGHSHEQVSFSATASENPSNFFMQGGGAASLGKSMQYGVDFVDTVRLDDVVQQEVMLMKIDVEGFEPYVFDGARNLLCHSLVHHILVEYSELRMEKKGSGTINTNCSTRLLLDWMVSLGFAISDVVPGAPKLPSSGWKGFPPNIHLEQLFPTSSPAARLGKCPELPPLPG